MNYIIDGHNLIAHIPGLSLGMPDDEEQLIELLDRFGGHERGRPLSGRAGRPRSGRTGKPLLSQAGRIEVYFDGAPIDQAGGHNYGRVQAYFVPSNSTADAAIRKRLARLGKSARNWVVITSDRSVQAAAREMHAGVMPADEFSLRLRQILRGDPEETSSPDKPLSPDEVDEWLTLFKQRKSTK